MSAANTADGTGPPTTSWRWWPASPASPPPIPSPTAEHTKGGQSPALRFIVAFPSDRDCCPVTKSLRCRHRLALRQRLRQVADRLAGSQGLGIRRSAASGYGKLIDIVLATPPPPPPAPPHPPPPLAPCPPPPPPPSHSPAPPPPPPAATPPAPPGSPSPTPPPPPAPPAAAPAPPPPRSVVPPW